MDRTEEHSRRTFEAEESVSSSILIMELVRLLRSWSFWADESGAGDGHVLLLEESGGRQGETVRSVRFTRG